MRPTTVTSQKVGQAEGGDSSGKEQVIEADGSVTSMDAAPWS